MDQDGRMSVIEATSVKVSTMIDGTFRLLVQVEPRDAVAAFTLFGSPGVPMALARLDTTALKNSQESPKKGIGGPLSQWVAVRCGEELFQKWIGVDSAEAAAETVRWLLGIKSRSEIDNDPKVRQDFEDHIRQPWAKYCSENA